MDARAPATLHRARYILLWSQFNLWDNKISAWRLKMLKCIGRRGQPASRRGYQHITIDGAATCQTSPPDQVLAHVARAAALQLNNFSHSVAARGAREGLWSEQLLEQSVKNSNRGRASSVKLNLKINGYYGAWLLSR